MGFRLMPGRIERKDVLNLAAGFLASCGTIGFACLLYLSPHWAHAASSVPDPAHGYVYAHNEHGRIIYFSAYQATACVLLSAISIPVGMLGALIMPKRDITYRQRRLAVRLTWDADDPKRLGRIGFACGAIAAPFIVFTVGPALVSALNSAGVVLSAG